MQDKYKVIIENFVHWGMQIDNLCAAFIIGSQSREVHGSDEYSDLDIAMIVENPDYFISSKQWLNEIGVPQVSFFIKGVGGGWRVIFDDALDVDFAICSKKDPIFVRADILQRGYNILLDKMGLKEKISQIDIGKQPYTLPSEQVINNKINSFWFHSVLAAKKIKRGELWNAKYYMDSHVKEILLSFIEYHTHATQGLGCNTWHEGRFIEEWADKWIIDMLSTCFSHYDKEDTIRSLSSMMDLFRLVSIKVSEKYNFQYPKKVDEYATKLIRATFT